jgi:hypothetical protein
VTAKELLAEVSALGFDAPLKADVAFITALNRSLSYIFKDRRYLGEHSFRALARQPVVRYPYVKFIGNSADALPLSGKVFSCYTHGSGSFTVKSDDRPPYTYSFYGETSRIIGELGTNSRLILSGYGTYYLTDLVTYDDVSKKTDLVPDGSPTLKINVSEKVPDFASFVGSPTNGSAPIEGAGVMGSTLYLPSTYTGTVCFRYRRKPPKVTSADMEVELDLPEDCDELLGLLVASFLYLDTNPELAERYSKLYKEAAERAPLTDKIVYSNEYLVKDGWA